MHYLSNLNCKSCENIVFKFFLLPFSWPLNHSYNWVKNAFYYRKNKLGFSIFIGILQKQFYYTDKLVKFEIYKNQICVLRIRNMDFKVSRFIQLLNSNIYMLQWFTMDLAERECLTLSLSISFLFYYIMQVKNC